MRCAGSGVGEGKGVGLGVGVEVGVGVKVGVGVNVTDGVGVGPKIGGSEEQAARRTAASDERNRPHRVSCRILYGWPRA